MIQINLEENEKHFIELEVKKELNATGVKEWKLGMLGQKAIKLAINKTISKFNDKLKKCQN